MVGEGYCGRPKPGALALDHLWLGVLGYVSGALFGVSRAGLLQEGSGCGCVARSRRAGGGEGVGVKEVASHGGRDVKEVAE